ncbi:MAG TPA: VWA domain-containing protein [Burkholderiales bacterium]|nr:VWA domain-containing protein [Burkholderiales bacterium]
MSWGVPIALLLVLGAVPLILFLHSLRPRGSKFSTTALFIWERVLKERPLASRMGWLLRKNLLLILQLLAATALIAALADPMLLHFGDPAGDTVVVMDLTASMKAKAAQGTRFDAARRQFLSLVDGLPSDARMMLIGAGAQTRVIVPFTADKTRLREAGRKLAPTDAAGDVRSAVLFAHAFLKKGSHDRVVVVSDGAFTGAEEFSRESASLRLIETAGGTQNIGIVGLDLRRHADGSQRYEVMAQVVNFGAQPARAVVTLALGQTVLAREDLAFEAGGRRVLVYPYEGAPAGTLTAQLDVDDDFVTDNRATLTISAAAPLELLYVGPGNPALSNLLRFFPNVQLTAVTSWEAEAARRETDPGKTYDAMIFDRVAPPALSEGNVIFINTVPPNLPIAVQGEVRAPRISAPLAKHAVTAGLSLGDLHVQESLRVAAGGDSLVLARAAETPLLVAIERAKLKSLYIGFDVMASDLPFRVAFPVLFHNVFEWFQPGRREFPADSVRAGAPLAIGVAPGDRELVVSAPSGRIERLAVTANPVIFGDTLETGIYSYRSAGREGRFAVNLFDEEESNIAARTRAAAAPAPAATADAGVTEAGLSLWPYLLGFVLLLLAVELIIAARGRLPLSPLMLRTGALAALAIACVNPKIFPAAAALDVILSVDVSRSVGQEGREKAAEVLAAAARLTTADTRTGLLAFGRVPEWEFPPRRELPAADFGARLDGESTDIEAALQAGLAQVGEGRQGKLLLVSDGNETRGNSARLIPLLRSQGTQVWTLPVSLARARNEVFVSDLVLPRQVDSAETFQIAARIESLRNAPAHIKLLRNGTLIGERELQLVDGVSEIAFRDSLTARGSHSYELLVEAKDDTLAENNLLQGVVEVRGPPRVLLLSSEREGQRFLARVLRVQGFDVTQSAPEAAGLALPQLSSYDLLVLDNVPAFQLTHAKMENIETYVRDLGGGLLVVGGSQSYGAGGYFRTPLERVLPVEMRPPARLDMPHVALLFVLDKSGSMGVGAEGGTKLDLAKAATLAAADIMNPTDQIGILAFDAAWDWALPFRAVGNGEWINDKLASLRSDGGTDLYKAMIEARRAMIGKEAAIKHVIVLSDGLTDKADFRPLIEELAQAGITVSTVSVGDDSDAKLMAQIARVGKGRSYVTLDPQTIPQIFTTETLLISRDLLIEKTFAPRLAARTGALRGIAQDTLPPLRGYVLTYPKERSELLMKAGEDPLLVAWRHGLGRVMAFTSDLSGRWGRDWVTWRGLPQWAGQAARDTMRRIGQARVRAELRPEGDAVRIVADLIAQDGRFVNHLKLRGNVTAPNRSTQHHTLPQSAPGRYEGTFRPAGRGIHFVTLFADGGANETPSPVTTIPYIAPYSREYRELRPNLAVLGRLAEETGGEMLDPQNFSAGLARLYTPSPGVASRGHETWWPLAIAALILFLGDLVVRSWPRADSTLKA